MVNKWIGYLGLLLCLQLGVFSANGNDVLKVLPAPEGYQFEIYVVGFKRNPDLTNLEKDLVNSFVNRVGEIGFQYLQANQLKDVSKSLLSLQEQVIVELKKINEKLPDNEELNYSIYLLPVAKQGVDSETAKLADFVDETFSVESQIGNITVHRIELGFSLGGIIDGNGALDFSKVSDADFYEYASVFSRLNVNLKKSQLTMFKSPAAWQGQPVFLNGAGIQLVIRKDGSAAQLQTLLGLKSMTENQNEESKEVVIKEVRIPEIKTDSEEPGFPVALISTEFSQKDSEKAPSVLIKFGALSGINGQGDYLGPFNLFGDELVSDPWSINQICDERIAATPQILGQWTSQALELPIGQSVANWIFKEKVVKFNIFSVELEVGEQGFLKNKYTDVRFSTLGLSCLKVQRVDDQFGKKIEDKISATINDLINIDDMTADLMGHIDKLWQ